MINKTHPLTKPLKRYHASALTPVKLTGVIAPWEPAFHGHGESDYKLVCSSGLEYFIVADPDWKNTLARYCWEDVRVVGLLNVSNMTLIPQKVFPKGPKGEKENAILPLPLPHGGGGGALIHHFELQPAL